MKLEGGKWEVESTFIVSALPLPQLLWDRTRRRLWSCKTHSDRHCHTPLRGHQASAPLRRNDGISTSSTLFEHGDIARDSVTSRTPVTAASSRLLCSALPETRHFQTRRLLFIGERSAKGAVFRLPHRTWPSLPFTVKIRPHLGPEIENFLAHRTLTSRPLQQAPPVHSCASVLHSCTPALPP